MCLLSSLPLLCLFGAHSFICFFFFRSRHIQANHGLKAPAYLHLFSADPTNTGIISPSRPLLRSPLCGSLHWGSSLLRKTLQQFFTLSAIASINTTQRFSLIHQFIGDRNFFAVLSPSHSLPTISTISTNPLKLLSEPIGIAIGTTALPNFSLNSLPRILSYLIFSLSILFKNINRGIFVVICIFPKLFPFLLYTEDLSNTMTVLLQPLMQRLFHPQNQSSQVHLVCCIYCFSIQSGIMGCPN